MNQKAKKQFTYWLSITAIGIVLGVSLQFVRAWTEPAVAPPGGNIGAPINTSGTAQTKAGNLNVNGGMLIGSSTTGGNKGAGTINADQVCIRGVCKTEWPSGSTTTTTNTNTTPSPPSSCSSPAGESGSTYSDCYCVGCSHLSADYTCINGVWAMTGGGVCTTWDACGCY